MAYDNVPVCQSGQQIFGLNVLEVAMTEIETSLVKEKVQKWQSARW